MTSVNAGVCCRLCLNLFTHSNTVVRHLDSPRLDRLLPLTALPGNEPQGKQQLMLCFVLIAIHRVCVNMIRK